MKAVGRATRIAGGADARTLPPGIRFSRLYRSASLGVSDVRCRACTPGVQAEETSSDSSIVLPRCGMFVKHVRAERVVADANQVLFFNQSEPYQVSHPVGCGDRCTSFWLSPALLEEMIAAHDPSVRDHPRRPFLPTHGPSTPEAFLLHRRLLQLLEATPPDLEVDGVVFDIVDSLLGASYAPVRAARRARPDTVAAHRDVAEAAKLELNRSFRGRVNLDDLGAAVHCSPYHLARVFRRHTGLPVHRYLNRLRLRAALDLIAGDRPSAVDLSQVARSVGFFDHSHFTNAFGREFGVAPSACRRPATARELRQKSKNFQVDGAAGS